MPGVFQTVIFQNSTGAIGTTQDITIAGFGQPQAVIFIPSRAFVLGGTLTDKTVGFGFTDGVTSYFQGSFGRHNAATTESFRYQDLSNPLAILDRGRTTRGQFAFNSWITDGIRLEVVEAAASSYYIGAIFLKGFDYATVAQHIFPASSTSSLVLTGSSGAPNIGLYVHGARGNSSGVDSNAHHSLGIVTDEGALVQRAVAEYSEDSASTMSTWQYISNTHALAQGSGTLDYELAVSAYTVDGSGDGQIDFPTTPAGLASDVVGVLALKAPAGDTFKLVDTIAQVASYSETGVGFQSDFAMVMTGSGWTTHDEDLNVGNINAWGVSAFEAVAGFTASANDRDGGTQSSCRNTFADEFEFIQYDGTTDCRGPIPTFDANGWSTTWNNPPAADRYGWALAYAEGAAGPSAGLSGSATLGIDGNDIRLGGKQIVITLTNDTWVAGASFDAQRQAIIDGLDAATTPTNGWNNEVRDNLPVTSVVRVNDTIANVNLNAQPGYNVLAQEVITSTIPAAALVTSGSDLTATPTFTVDPGDKGPATPDTFNEVTPQDTQLSASVGTVTDPDGLAAIPFNVTPANEPDNGTLTSFNNTTGDYLYDPNTSYVGPDSFIVTVTDLKGFTSSVTVNIDVQASASAAVEGTVVPTANESEIVTGGEVIDIRLTGDEWVAAGPTFDAVRQDIINGLNSDGVELTGWNNEVRDKEVVTAVNRASNTLVRITLSPSAAYAIDNSETITVTVPAVALVTTTTDFDASPTFSIIPEAVSGVAPGGLQNLGQQFMPNASTRLGGVLDE